MIDVSVKKAFGAFNLKAEVHDQGFICLSGKNGSGKSTLLKVIAGQLKPDDGFVRLNSIEVTPKPIEERRIVLVTPDSYIPHLTVDAHLRWGMRARKVLHPEDFISEVREALRITYDGRVDSLSLGMRERVSLATALLSAPNVLLVDEAFSNLDDRDGFIQTYRRLCARGKADVIFTTQRKDEADGADHHYQMEDGNSVRLF